MNVDRAGTSVWNDNGIDVIDLPLGIGITSRILKTPLLPNDYLRYMNPSFNILVVEDEELFASQIEVQISMLGYQLVDIVDNSDAALAAMQKHPVDLVVMDINIQGAYDGIELADLISVNHQVPIVFITSHEDDMTFKRASRSDPSAFLLKPFTDLQFKRTIELALKKFDEQTAPDEITSAEVTQDGVLFIKKKQKIHKVAVDEIFYLEADGKYTRVYTKSEIFLVRRSLSDMVSRLPDQDFVKCHRSYVVNMNKVKSIDLVDDVLILEERTVPVSKREKDKLLDRLKWI